MEHNEQYVEVKPVVKSKDLYKAVRNIISNELKLDKAAFEKLVAARVDNYLTGNGLNDLIKTEVARRLKGSSWPSPAQFEGYIAVQVNTALNELIGAEVRKIVTDKLKDGLAGLA